MKLNVVGLSHDTAPEEVRAKAGFIKREVLETALALKDHFDEAIVLSTCNRAEIYVYGEGDLTKVTDIFKARGIGPEHLFIKRGEDALTHLFEVSAGLDSIVTFEDQILGQLKEAQSLAANIGSTGKFLNKYFREAVHFGKTVRNKYRVSQVPTSMSATCVKYLKRIFDDYEDKKVLVIGSGTMGRLALLHLKEEGFKNLTVTNRTYHPNDRFQRVFQGVSRIDYADRYKVLPDTDAVICATSSAHTILRDSEMPEVGDILLFDLALPIDIERKIGKRPGVKLFTVDDFKEITRKVEDFHDRMRAPVYEDLKKAVAQVQEWQERTFFDEDIKSLAESRDRVLGGFEDFLSLREDLDERQKLKLKKVMRAGLNDLVTPMILRLKNLKDHKEEVKSALNLLGSVPYERKNESTD